jgi:hypothetical protein
MDSQLAEDLETPLDGIEKEYLLCNQNYKSWLAYHRLDMSQKRVFKDLEFDGKHSGKTLLKAWRSARNDGKRLSDNHEGPTAKKVKLE